MITASHEIIETTLNYLKDAGSQRKEGIVLWLGSRSGDLAGVVQQAYVPLHQAEKDRFWIPLEGMQAMMGKLKKEKLALIAQVHSHPFEAFHSEADDRWAIVRYAGALSIVVPQFASETSPASFVKDSVFFALSENDEWLAADPHRVFAEVR